MKSSLEQEFALHLPKGNKPWFEGWYVRVQTKEISFAIIFGLQISNAKKSAFIQFLDTHTKKSRYVEYPWKAVTIQQHPFVLNIRGNRNTAPAAAAGGSAAQLLNTAAYFPVCTDHYGSVFLRAYGMCAFHHFSASHRQRNNPTEQSLLSDSW